MNERYGPSIETTPERQERMLGQLDRASRIASFLEMKLVPGVATVEVPLAPGSKETMTADRTILEMSRHVMYTRVNELTSEGREADAWNVIGRYFRQPGETPKPNPRPTDQPPKGPGPGRPTV